MDPFTVLLLVLIYGGAVYGGALCVRVAIGRHQRQDNDLLRTFAQRYAHYRSILITPEERPTQRSPQAIIAELRSALASREETIKDLREKGHRAVADPDRWEAEAKKLQREIAGLINRAAAAASGVRDVDANKYWELKAALAKMFHPDALTLASDFERIAREALYKEINVEIERIEKGRRQP
jgi:hypothetical protein